MMLSVVLGTSSGVRAVVLGIKRPSSRFVRPENAPSRHHTVDGAALVKRTAEDSFAGVMIQLLEVELAAVVEPHDDTNQKQI